MEPLHGTCCGHVSQRVLSLLHRLRIGNLLVPSVIRIQHCNHVDRQVMQISMGQDEMIKRAGFDLTQVFITKVDSLQRSLRILITRLRILMFLGTALNQVIHHII